MTAERTLELPALGRPMQLGMLYDCRSDTPIPGITLWDPAILHADCNVIPKPGTQFSIISSDGVEDKTSALNVEAELKASFLCGLVEVQGAAKYLNDTKASECQSRLTLHYEETTRFEQLTMKHLGRHNVQHADVVDQGTATHVVTGILYGAKAFLVFDRDCTSEEKIKNVQGRLKALVEKILLLNFRVGGSVTLSDQEKKEQTKIRCTFHGDFALRANPSNFEEAIEVYKQLPTVLGKNGENAVPIRVSLYPLVKLDDMSAKLAREIPVNLIADSQKILERLDQMQVKCDDTKTQKICTDFPQFVDKIDNLKDLLQRKKLSFRQFLARVLPQIRGGSVQENELDKAVVDFKHCPFNLNQVEDWLSKLDKEMSVVKAYVKYFEGIQIISSRADLEALILDPSIKHIVCFAFPCIGHEDKYLTVLSKCLQSSKADSESYIPAKKGWFNGVTAYKNIRRYAESFVEFYRANLTNPTTIFTVTGFDDGDHEATVRGSMFLYDYGVLKTKTFEPPGKPVKLKVSGKSHDSVSLEWQPPSHGVPELKHYIVKCREAAIPQSDSTDWIELQTDGADVTVIGLSPFTSYEFKVVSVCQAGVSQASETTSAKTYPSSPPTQLRKQRASKCSISIGWSKPSQIGKGLIINNYLVKYRPASGPSESKVHEKVYTSDQSCAFTIDELHNDTPYEFLVSAICSGSIIGAESDSIEVRTGLSQKTEGYAHQIAKESQVLSRGCVAKGKPEILQLPLKKLRCHRNAKYCSYSFGMKSGTCPSQDKVIMVVGATGAGKSTLINGMVNYILQVEWEDEFRFKIVDDQADGKSKSQADSQTQIITSYTIHKHKNHSISYTLTIIDTPGFGDTTGIEQDKAITDQIRDFFSHSDTHQIDHIDGIGFVAQASLARQTPTQGYVFDSILSVFGKDISPNILLLVTFADGKDPPLIAALQEAGIPCSDELFKFNNSALFANNKVESARSVVDDFCAGASEGDDIASFDKMFWKMGFHSMSKFFHALGQLDPRSLSLTKEVIDERKRLEVSLEGIQPQIRVAVCKLEELRREHEILEQHEVNIEANKDFYFEVYVPKTKKIDISGTGNYITNCSVCHFTCHYPCTITDQTKLSGCFAITDGRCRVCPGKCIWNVHFNQQYKFHYYCEKEKRKYTDLEKRYKDARAKKLSVEQVIRRQLQELKDVMEGVTVLVTRSHASIKRLDEIALRPNPLSTVEHVDLMIESEKKEAEYGWSSRVRALKDVREQADIMSRVKGGNFNPLEPYAEPQMAKGDNQGWLSYAWGKFAPSTDKNKGKTTK